jgi:hypothetical protein
MSRLWETVVKVDNDALYPYHVFIEKDSTEIWEWVKEKIVHGIWKMRFGLIGYSATYCFKTMEDATIFSLRWE